MAATYGGVAVGKYCSPTILPIVSKVLIVQVAFRFLQYLPAPVTVKTLQGRFEWCNHECEVLFGERVEGLRGRTTKDLLRLEGLVLRQGMALAAIGLGIGLAAAMALTHLISSLLFGVTPNDPFTLAAVAAILLTVAGGVTLVPALRATQVDSLTALRDE